MADTENNLKKYIKEKGLTLAELGDMIGYPHQSISRWCRGLATPDMFTAFKIAEILEVRVEDIWEVGKPMGITDRLDHIVTKFCTNYCKWPDKWDEKKEGIELCESEICANCPLNEI